MSVKCQSVYYIQKKENDTLPYEVDVTELNLMESYSPVVFMANNPPFRWSITPKEGEAIRYSEEKKLLFERLIRSSKDQLHFCLCDGFYKPLLAQMQRAGWSLYFSRICQNQTRRDDAKKLDWLFNTLSGVHRKRAHRSSFYPIALSANSHNDYSFYRVNPENPPDIENIYFVCDIEASANAPEETLFFLREHYVRDTKMRFSCNILGNSVAGSERPAWLSLSDIQVDSNQLQRLLMKESHEGEHQYIKQEEYEDDDYLHYYDRDVDEYYKRQVKRVRKVNWVLSQPRWVLYGDVMNPPESMVMMKVCSAQREFGPRRGMLPTVEVIQFRYFVSMSKVMRELRKVS